MAKGRNVVLSVTVRVAACIIFLLLAMAIFMVLVKTKPVPARTDRGNEAPRVVVMPARAVEVCRQWEGHGTARAMDSANVPARVTATVSEIHEDVLPGTWVEQGQLLVRFDESDLLVLARLAAKARWKGRPVGWLVVALATEAWRKWGPFSRQETGGSGQGDEQ